MTTIVCFSPVFDNLFRIMIPICAYLQPNVAVLASDKLASPTIQTMLLALHAVREGTSK